VPFQRGDAAPQRREGGRRWTAGTGGQVKRGLHVAQASAQRGYLGRLLHQQRADSVIIAIRWGV
jgi:hypothetical protein